MAARKPQSTPHGGGLFETLEYRVPISPRSAILMTWADQPDARARAYKHDAGALNAFTVAEASPQWFHLPGVSPPVPTGSFSPLSPRFVDGYTERAARNAERRARAEGIVQARIGIDTLGEATTEVVHISTPSSD